MDETSGQVFLISRLAYDISSSSNFETLTIYATNGASQISETNTIYIVDANKTPPYFVSSQRIFEIEEVNLVTFLF